MTPLARFAVHGLAITLGLTAGLGPPREVRADGGSVVHVEKVPGATITLFAPPYPTTTGPLDLSFLVQRAPSGDVIEEAQLAVVCQRANGANRVSAPISREQATNKLLQATLLDFPAAGTWNVAVTVSFDGRVVEFEFPFQVADAATESVWFRATVIPLAGVIGFLIHRRLKSRLRASLMRRQVAR